MIRGWKVGAMGTWCFAPQESAMHRGMRALEQREKRQADISINFKQNQS